MRILWYDTSLSLSHGITSAQFVHEGNASRYATRLHAPRSTSPCALDKSRLHGTEQDPRQDNRLRPAQVPSSEARTWLGCRSSCIVAQQSSPGLLRVASRNVQYLGPAGPLASHWGSRNGDSAIIEALPQNMLAKEENCIPSCTSDLLEIITEAQRTGVVKYAIDNDQVLNQDGTGWTSRGTDRYLPHELL